MGAKLPPFSISEEDGSPTIWQPWQIKFSNGVVTDNGDGTCSVNILSAGSPVLRKGNVFYLNTDGNTANFLNGAGLFTSPSGGAAIAYAPSNATYIVQTNNTVLTNEQVLAALSSGL